MRDRQKFDKIKLPRLIHRKEPIPYEHIAQDMRFRQFLMKYAEKYGVSRASRKYSKGRSYIYFGKSRWDGSVESLAEKSKRPHHHPNEHTEEEIAMIQRY